MSINIRSLFRFGASDDAKTETVKLENNLAALFGAQDGESIGIEAPPESVGLIEAAESSLQSIADQQQETAAELKAANASIVEKDAEIAELNKQIKANEAEIERLGILPAGNHTTPKSGDGEGGDGKRVSKHQAEANEAIAKAKRKLKAQD